MPSPLDTQAKAGGPPREGSDVEAHLGLAPGGRVFATRMLRLHNGPGIELFEMTAPDQRPAARPSDLGLQHVALYVDDLEAATVRFAAAGGQLLTGPHALPPPEGGEGNAFRYGRAPWGMVIEFLTYPSPQPYRERTQLRRWTPRP